MRALTHALDGARLHHAYLFTGTRGVGKTTLSRIFAKALNCETGITATPCGVCRACREIDEGRFIDYVEMDAASNRGVDEMAALLERAVYAPVDARFKVYMIDEVHMLTNHAFNAMLKTLEEPPPHIKFILATTDPQKIPVTVLSRCLQFNLKQMPAGHIVDHLERILAAEQIASEPQALRLLARAAEGSMRDALSLTDQAIAYSANHVTEEAVRGMLGALDQSYLIRLLDAITVGDGQLVLSVADEMASRSLSFSTALQDLASLLHRVAWAQFAPASVLDEWPEAADLRRFAQALTPEQVQLFYQIATLGRSELGLAPDEYAGFTMTLLRMLAFEPAPPPGPGPSGQAPKNAGQAGASNGAVSRRAPVTARADGQPEPTEPPAAPSRAADTQAPAAAPTQSQTEPATATPPVDAREDAPASMSQDVAEQHESQRVSPPEAQVRSEAARPRAGGPSAALDVLRNAGLRVSTDRSRAAAKPVAAVPVKAAAPRAPVAVPTPRPRRPEPQAAQPARPASPGAASSPAPWDEMPPLDDFPPPSSEDDYFAGPPDDGFSPGFGAGPDDVRLDTGFDVSAAPTTPSVDLSQLPPSVALDSLGFAGDWPALASSLGLTGVAHQLAFNSELTELAGDSTIMLSVPVPQYADSAQVAKLEAALAEKLGKIVDVRVSVGVARRTAAVLEAAARAQRQREAEREIGADPFVQALIREFGASIVPGSVRPVSPDAAARPAAR